MSQFQIGNRVVYINDEAEKRRSQGPKRGQIGTVCGIYLNGLLPYLVEFDQPVLFGHDGDGSAKRGHGWYCLGEQLEFAKEDDVGQVDCSVALEEIL